jgi:hypothetical protein
VTRAVCEKCGAFKLGAFTPCNACRFDPATDEDKAKALMLSDRNLDRAALEAASAGIRAGTAPKFDPAQVAQLAAGIRDAPVRKPNVAFALAFVITVLVLTIGIIFFIRWVLSLVL